MRRPRPLRRAAAGADPPRRLGLPDHRPRPDSEAAGADRPARGRDLPCPGAGPATHAGVEMSITLLGIVDDRALGTSMRLIVTRPEMLTAAKAAVDRVITAIDEAASRFRADSELSRINREPGRQMRISRLLAQALAAGLRGARLTDGAVDPTVGSAVRLAGYDRDFAAIPADGSPINLAVSHVPGWKAIEFDEGARTVSVPRGVAATCVDANIASTAAIVMGEPAIRWLTARGLPARLVDRDGIVHRVAGWPERAARERKS